MANGELVMEVDRSLAEGGHHLVVVGEGALDHLCPELLALLAEVLQVPAQEGPVDFHQRVLTWELHGQRHEQPLQPRVDEEGPRRGVHARDVLRVVDVLLGELGAVKPVAPPEMLPDKRDGHGGVVRVQLGHVHVVHEVDELVLPGRAVVDPGLLLQLRLHYLLEGDDVGEVVERDGQGHQALTHVAKLAFNELCLAGPGQPDKHHGPAHD
mmetsp:Transcript_24996/g.41822  ORF Transcript_24996/g.41822 Transcript_24996/m.41822 type:complete len:211 (+) Transcript_24996:4817-5449(+)